MHRDTDGSRLIGDRSGDGLTDPPGRIGGELISFTIIEFLYSFDQTQVTFLDQV